MPSSAEAEFARQLDIFHSECEDAVRFFYAGRAIHASILIQPDAIAVLNKTPIFWNTTYDALKLSCLVTLGRIFDPNTQNHSLTRLLAFAHANLDIFSRTAFEKRVFREVWPGGEPYVPTANDFRRLKKLVASRRKEYETSLRPWRHELYAHRVVRDPTEFKGIPQDLDATRMEKLVSFLPRLHNALWRLFHEAQRPALRPARRSTERMLRLPSKRASVPTLQERLTHEVNSILLPR